MAIAKPVTRTVIATPTWGFPVTDEVNRLTSEGAANLAKLASLQAIINAMLTPTWIPMTLAAPWVPFASGYATPGYCVQGSWVWCRGMMRQNDPTAVTAQSTFTTMPTEARPIQTLSVGVLALTGGSGGVAPMKRLIINTNGNLQIVPTPDTFSQNAWVSLEFRYNLQAAV